MVEQVIVRVGVAELGEGVSGDASTFALALAVILVDLLVAGGGGRAGRSKIKRNSLDFLLHKKLGLLVFQSPCVRVEPVGVVAAVPGDLSEGGEGPAAEVEVEAGGGSAEAVDEAADLVGTEAKKSRQIEF